MKRCSTSFVIKILQIKTTMRYSCTSIIIAKIQKKSPTIINSAKGVQQQALWFNADGNAVTLEYSVAVFCFLRMLRLMSIYNAANGICPSDWKIHLHTYTCILFLISTLFIITKTWKQPDSLSTGEKERPASCKQQSI